MQFGGILTENVDLGAKFLRWSSNAEKRMFSLVGKGGDFFSFKLYFIYIFSIFLPSSRPNPNFFSLKLYAHQEKFSLKISAQLVQPFRRS